MTGATVVYVAAETAISWDVVGVKIMEFFTSIDYSIAFGALAGSICFVVTARNLSRCQILGYFLFGYAVGVSGASFVADKAADYLNYRETKLDTLAAVLISAVAVQSYFWLKNGGLFKLPFIKKILGGNE